MVSLLLCNNSFYIITITNTLVFNSNLRPQRSSTAMIHFWISLGTATFVFYWSWLRSGSSSISISIRWLGRVLLIQVTVLSNVILINQTGRALLCYLLHQSFDNVSVHSILVLPSIYNVPVPLFEWGGLFCCFYYFDWSVDVFLMSIDISFTILIHIIQVHSIPFKIRH